MLNMPYINCVCRGHTVFMLSVSMFICLSVCLSICYVLVSVWEVSNKHCLLTFILIYLGQENICVWYRRLTDVFFQINQLRHDLSMKEELLKFYTQNYENHDSPNTPE